MFLTSAELALATPAATLLGVALGTLGTTWGAVRLDRSRERRAAREAREQAITEVQTAVVDLLTGVQAIRGAYRHQTQWRNYIRIGTLVTASAGSIMTSGETLSRKLLDLHRISPAFERLLTEDRALDDRQRTTALDMAAIVGPRVTRFYEASGKLTLGTDDKIADATRELIRAVGGLLEVISERDKAYVTARQRVEGALESFREIVGQEHRRRTADRHRTRRHSSLSWPLIERRMASQASAVHPRPPLAPTPAQPLPPLVRANRSSRVSL